MIEEPNSLELPTFKSRVLEKGFTQREGIDYGEIVSPFVNHPLIKIILAMVAHFDIELEQMDVKTNLSPWKYERNHFYATTKGFCSSRKGRLGMSP